MFIIVSLLQSARGRSKRDLGGHCWQEDVSPCCWLVVSRPQPSQFIKLGRSLGCTSAALSSRRASPLLGRCSRIFTGPTLSRLRWYGMAQAHSPEKMVEDVRMTVLDEPTGDAAPVSVRPARFRSAPPPHLAHTDPPLVLASASHAV
jgi:hypothetical protein